MLDFILYLISEFIKNMRENKGAIQKTPLTVPNLSDKQLLTKAAENELGKIFIYLPLLLLFNVTHPC